MLKALKNTKWLRLFALFLAFILILGAVNSGLFGAAGTEGAVLANIAPLTTSVNTIQWTPISAERPFGSVSEFGVFVFGDIEASNGYIHMEGGVAVRGSLILTHASADFGEAHYPEVGIQLPHTPDARTVIGGNLTGYQEAYGYYLLRVYGGELLLDPVTTVSVHDVGDVIETQAHLDVYTRTYALPNHPWATLTFDDIPRALPGEITEFFDAAFIDLTGLSERFANPNLVNVSGFYLTTLDTNGHVIMPEYPAEFHTIVVTVTIPVDSRIPPINLDMQGFAGNYVIIVPNTVPVSVVHNTFFVNPPSINPYELGRLFSHRILWNFTGNGTITHNNYTTIGTVLAPRANFYAPDGGNVGGMLIVSDFTHGGGVGGFEQHTVSKQQHPNLHPPPWVLPPVEIPTEPPEPPPTNGIGENGNGENGNGVIGNGYTAVAGAGADAGIPRTGDDSSIFLWLMLMLLSAAALGILIIIRRQRRA